MRSSFLKDLRSGANHSKKNTTALVERNECDNSSEVEGMKSLIISFKPALSSVLEPCEEYDILMTMVQSMFKAPWEGANRRLTRPAIPRKGPVIPGSDQSIDVEFYCSVCDQIVDVPHEKKLEILSSEDEVQLPVHCDQPVKIRITRKQEAAIEEEAKEDTPVEPIELLMGYLPADNVEYLKVTSVGIDIHVTSHLLTTHSKTRNKSIQHDKSFQPRESGDPV